MHLIFAVSPDPTARLPVYDITMPFLIVAGIVVVILTVYWLRRKANP